MSTPDEIELARRRDRAKFAKRRARAAKRLADIAAGIRPATRPTHAIDRVVKEREEAMVYEPRVMRVAR